MTLDLNKSPGPILLVCALVIVLVIVWMVRGCGSDLPDFESQVEAIRTVPEVMAEETAGLVGDAGGIVVIAEEPPDPQADDQTLEQFTAAAREAGLEILEVRQVSFGATGEDGTAVVLLGLAGSVVTDLVEQHPDAGAVVILCGMPDFNRQHVRALKKSGVPLVLFCGGGTRGRLRRLLSDGVVGRAVVPRFQALAPGEDETNFFRKHFQIVTADDAADLPAF